MGKKQLSGARKRKKKKEREELALDMERLKLGPTKLWTGLVVHHKDVFVSHVISKLNRTDRWFFSKVNGESRGVLEYAGVNVSGLSASVYECSSISTLEWAWNNMPWGKKDGDGTVRDQAWFCREVAATNKLELLKWAREVKQCEWDEWTIIVAASFGNLEMLKYCFSNDCPCDEEEACKVAAIKGHLDCLRFLFDKLKPSRETERTAAIQAAGLGHTDILKYFVEERKIWDDLKLDCVATAASCCTAWQTRLYQILIRRRGENASEQLAIHRVRSLLRTPRLRKLLARKRVPRTNGRTIRCVHRSGKRRGVGANALRFGR